MSRTARAYISPAEQERRRQLYLERIKENTRGFVEKFQAMLDEMHNDGLNMYVPNELNEIKHLLSETIRNIETSPEEARNISNQVGQKISKIRVLAQSAKKRIEFEEKQKRKKLMELKDDIDTQLDNFLSELFNSIEDPIVKDFAFDGYLKIKTDLSNKNKTISNLEKVKVETKSKMDKILLKAKTDAEDWKSKEEKENKTQVNNELSKIYEEQISQSEKENPIGIKSVLENFKSIDVNINSDEFAKRMQNSLEKSDEVILDERIRKSTVIGIIKSLKSAGFSVGKPKITEDGYVKVLAKKPSGNTALCKVDIEGKFEYKFDSYKGMSCLKDIESFETDLEKVYGFKLSDKRVLWENPDRIKKGSRENPTGGKTRGAN